MGNHHPYRNIRMIAEWESCGSVLLALPEVHTDWNYILPEAREQYRLLIEALTTHGVNCLVLTSNEIRASHLLENCDPKRLTLVEMMYNDTWTRDYGPISVERGERLRALDFGFNGWGLKFAADRDNLVNLHLDERWFFEKSVYRNERDFILEGGSIETDGDGTFLTTTRCLTSPNRNGGKTKAEVGAILEQRLGAEHILWLDYGALAGDDTDSHIDTLCRMAPGNTIIFTGCRDMDNPHFEELLKMRAQLEMFRTKEGMPYNLVELPLPDTLVDENGDPMPATYANYLVTPECIFMPVYGQPQNDTLACHTVRIAFPDHEVVPVDCRTLIRQHGSLHCSTMQLPEDLLNPDVFPE